MEGARIGKHEQAGERNIPQLKIKMKFQLKRKD